MYKIVSWHIIDWIKKCSMRIIYQLLEDTWKIQYTLHQSVCPLNDLYSQQNDWHNVGKHYSIQRRLHTTNKYRFILACPMNYSWRRLSVNGKQTHAKPESSVRWIVIRIRWWCGVAELSRISAKPFIVDQGQAINLFNVRHSISIVSTCQSKIPTEK